MPTVTLASGTAMPAVGLGTWQLTGDAAAEGVRHALVLGYRLVDTAEDYRNQREVGAAIRASEIGRDEVFVVSKVEEDEDAHAATGDRLEELGLERLDLCLLHRPPPDDSGEALWAGLIEARRDGLTREIGVSNYSPRQIDELIEATGEVPAVNQIEWSPFGHSAEVMDHARARGVAIQAYCPLTRGERLGEPEVTETAAAHDRTPAQILLRWSLQSGAAVVPKAAGARHRAENLALFDFELDTAEMRRLGDLNRHYSALAGLPYL